MTRKTELVDRLPELLLGKIVRAQDGHRLGRITKLGAQSLDVEQGLFKHRTFHLDYDELTSANGNSVYVSVDRDDARGTAHSIKMETL